MHYALSILSLFLILATTGLADAHSINYQVENRGISARFFFAPKDPVSYSAYEIYGPGDTIPHQKGKTDRNGFVSFLPDRPGKWSIKVIGEIEHGAHSALITMEINEVLNMTSFDKPLVALHTKAFVGISMVLFIFSLLVLIRNKKDS